MNGFDFYTKAAKGAKSSALRSRDLQRAVIDRVDERGEWPENTRRTLQLSVFGPGRFADFGRLVFKRLGRVSG